MTAQPTREYRQHHDVEAPAVDATAFRQGWRIRTRLDQLLADGRISRSDWQAASEFRDAWAIARELARGNASLGLIRVAAATATDNGVIAKLDAAKRLRMAERAIGPFATALIVACVVEDMSWAAVGRYCHRDPTTVRNRTVVAIRKLGQVWEASRHGR